MFPFHIATPQGCNIQTFYGSANVPGNDTRNWRTWNKPVGVSHVYMLLIGAGGMGTATLSGGSGAVTVWYGAAQHVPDVLQVFAKGPFTTSGGASEVAYLSRSASFVELLQAGSSSNNQAGVAYSPNYFTASGFFQSVAGQAGTNDANVSPSTTTFLSAGCGTSTGTVNGNYGYTASGSTNGGYFQLQPIIVGVGSNQQARSAIGCGARVGGTDNGAGMVLIASW
jgi:hypothetical protein